MRLSPARLNLIAAAIAFVVVSALYALSGICCPIVLRVPIPGAW